MPAEAISVSQLNSYIKTLLDTTPALGSVWVRGEISNFTNHYSSGHFYFSLKDENSIIRAMIYRSNAVRLIFAPKDSMKVLAHGRVSAYPQNGQYQLYVDAMQPDGVGALALAYEQLKQKLTAEGLFRQESKRPLPRYPLNIGVITSPTGAAVRDIINITGRRWPSARIFLYPALVQGNDAAPSLIAGMNFFNATKNIDLIIIGRGGGSMEDLWAFNDEALVRCVAASRLPVISAVGHETDFTLCDFAADCRAPTPSAAAELAVPDWREIMATLCKYGDRLQGQMENRLAVSRAALRALAGRRVLQTPMNLVEDRRIDLSNKEERFTRAFSVLLQSDRSRFAFSAGKLGALNPLAILSRGYSAVSRPDGAILSSVESLSPGDEVRVQMRDGAFRAAVQSVSLSAREPKTKSRKPRTAQKAGQTNSDIRPEGEPHGKP